MKVCRMKKIINHLFSDKYVNHKAVVNNDLLLLMYRTSYPFAVFLNKLRLTPNQITTQSLIFSILAFFALVYDEGWVWFSLFWGISVLFDFCDGTVARMTDRVSKTAFRYDHMSDTFKISLLVLGVGIRNNNMFFWILCATLIFLYTFSEILSHDLSNAVRSRQNINLSICIDTNNAFKKIISERYFLVGIVIEKFPSLINSLKKIYYAVFSFNGHTLLCFFAFPIGGSVTKITFLYLMFLTMASSMSSINSLRSIRR